MWGRREERGEGRRIEKELSDCSPPFLPVTPPASPFLSLACVLALCAESSRVSRSRSRCSGARTRFRTRSSGSRTASGPSTAGRTWTASGRRSPARSTLPVGASSSQPSPSPSLFLLLSLPAPLSHIHTLYPHSPRCGAHNPLFDTLMPFFAPQPRRTSSSRRATRRCRGTTSGRASPQSSLSRCQTPSLRGRRRHGWAILKSGRSSRGLQQR
jgi:hypothetical protein